MSLRGALRQAQGKLRDEAISHYASCEIATPRPDDSGQGGARNDSSVSGRLLQ
jgi:hypothetical protein